MAGDGGEAQPWCCARRDTRGKRGYDGDGGAGMTEMARAGVTGEGAEAAPVAACATSVPGAGRFPLGGGNDGKKGRE